MALRLPESSTLCMKLQHGISSTHCTSALQRCRLGGFAICFSERMTLLTNCIVAAAVQHSCAIVVAVTRLPANLAARSRVCDADGG
jgi:hypothetical protein